jgi:hypothetical protein
MGISRQVLEYLCTSGHATGTGYVLCLLAMALEACTWLVGFTNATTVSFTVCHQVVPGQSEPNKESYVKWLHGAWMNGGYLSNAAVLSCRLLSLLQGE